MYTLLPLQKNNSKNNDISIMHFIVDKVFAMYPLSGNPKLPKKLWKEQF